MEKAAKRLKHLAYREENNPERRQKDFVFRS